MIQIVHIHYIYSCRLEKIKVTAKRGLEMIRILSWNSAIKMKNGIRKVRTGVDIFNKRSLDSCKIQLGQLLVLTSWCLHIEPDSIEKIFSTEYKATKKLLRNIFKALSSKIWSTFIKLHKLERNHKMNKEVTIENVLIFIYTK